MAHIKDIRAIPNAQTSQKHGCMENLGLIASDEIVGGIMLQIIAGAFRALRQNTKSALQGGPDCRTFYVNYTVSIRRSASCTASEPALPLQKKLMSKNSSSRPLSESEGFA
ncbi:MAG: hypothetical protein LBD21_11305, partial [Tannerellaceae bacterium]|nr:hypothetical protein [Tannerellaceae bacterium]